MARPATLQLSMEKLTNNILTLSVSPHGAELQSIQKNGKEYLWQGDARIWGRHSPVLFPMVGRVWNNTYRHNGHTYELGQHGFARDMEFECIEQSSNQLTYRLRSTPETQNKFPFDFELRISYQLKDNRIEVKWQVINTGKDCMPFQIGAHPAFYLDNFNEGDSVHGYFAFNNPGQLEYVMPQEKGCTSPKRHSLHLNDENLMPIGLHTFDCDTYIIDNSQLKSVSLLSKSKQRLVTLEFNAPLVALWSPTKTHPECPFVCIEPWYGRCDNVGYNGEWKDREWMQQLNPAESFCASYTIIIE